MKQLLNLFFDICLLRRGPQDVPASVWLLRATLVCYVVLGAVLLSFSGDPLWRTGVEVVIDLALLSGITWSALSWRRLQARFAQTLTALLGTGVVLYAIDLPVVHWLNVSAVGGRPDPLAVMIWFVLILWGLTVMGHVMRHALQANFALGMLVAVGYFSAETLLFNLVFPGGA